MDGLRQYVLTMILAAILCAVVVSIMPEKAGKQSVIRMICGLYLLLVACKPMGIISFAAEENDLVTYRQEAEQMQTEARKQADEAMTAVIKAQTETYIEDKAEALGATVTAGVMLAEDMLPWQVELTGEVSPYVKTRLVQTIWADLGIPEERQVWLP